MMKFHWTENSSDLLEYLMEISSQKAQLFI